MCECAISRELYYIRGSPHFLSIPPSFFSFFSIDKTLSLWTSVCNVDRIPRSLGSDERNYHSGRHIIEFRRFFFRPFASLFNVPLYWLLRFRKISRSVRVKVGETTYGIFDICDIFSLPITNTSTYFIIFFRVYLRTRLIIIIIFNLTRRRRNQSFQ